MYDTPWNTRIARRQGLDITLRPSGRPRKTGKIPSCHLLLASGAIPQKIHPQILRKNHFFMLLEPSKFFW